MDYFEEIKNRFTAYIKSVIQNASTDYKRKLLRTIEKEISVSDYTYISSTKELLSCDDNSFLLEKDVTHINIENLFTSENHYQAMKKLSDREKLVLYLSVVEEYKSENIAVIMNTTAENIWQIKSRAIKKFLCNLEKEK